MFSGRFRTNYNKKCKKIFFDFPSVPRSLGPSVPRSRYIEGHNFFSESSNLLKLSLNGPLLLANVNDILIIFVGSPQECQKLIFKGFVSIFFHFLHNFLLYFLLLTIFYDIFLKTFLTIFLTISLTIFLFLFYFIFFEKLFFF